MRFKILALLYVLLYGGCIPLKQSPKYELGDEYYTFRQKGAKSQKVLVLVEGDSIELFREITKGDRIYPKPSKDMYFRKASFDLDLLTAPFKWRPAKPRLPAQLNPDFNGNVFVGYRVDRFRVHGITTPVGIRQRVAHEAVTVGAFGGVGATPLTPWTTNNMITDEYSGAVLTRGLAVMIGFHNHTAGLGVGWDYLTGRDKNIWIYQNEVWYGVTIGVNIN